MGLTVEDAYMILNALPHVGPVTLQRLLESFEGDPVAILQANQKRLEKVHDVGPVIAQTICGWKGLVDLDEQKRKLSASGVVFLSRDHADYPVLLREIYDAPIGLYCKGSLKMDTPCIGFVGTRRATLYGTSIAKKMSSELARRGYCVVSGMARGIDTSAHRGALESDGKTVAVLGCGIDIVYPPENYDLYRDIAVSGAVISEFPFGRRADKQTFPMRNRIIAGMCKGIVIVESGLEGGSMITARFAAEQGRHVFAIPGRIDQESSRGCHALIREGVTLVTCVEDILEELDIYFQRELLFEEQNDIKKSALALATSNLSEDERAVLNLLTGSGALSVDTTSVTLNMPPNRAAGALLMLELKKISAKRADGKYELLVKL